MLFQPTNVIPSSFAGEGGDLIDATEGMTISWQVNGTSPMTGYRIYLFKTRVSDGLYNIAYDSEWVTLAEPFYGVDGEGNEQRYSVTLSAATLSAGAIVNDTTRSYAYTLQIDMRSNTSTVTGRQEYFYPSAKPTVTIDTTAITGPSAALTGTYTQAGGVGLDWVRWVVTKGGTTVHDSGKIHTQELNYTYDGFLDDTEYDITLSYQTQSGYTGSVSTTITSDWDLVEMRSSELGVAPTSDCMGLVLDTPNVSVGMLVSDTAEHTITEGVLSITTDKAVGNLQWEGNAGIAGDTLVWRGKIQQGGSFGLSVSTTGGYGGPQEFYIGPNSPGSDFWKFGWNDNNEMSVAEISLPGTFEYDSDILMIANNKTLFIWAGPLRIANNNPLESTSEGAPFLSTAGNATISLFGIQQCYYFGVGRFGDLALDSEIVTMLRNTTQPEFSEDWIYLTDWASAGVEDIGQFSDTTSTTATVYRHDMSAGIMQKLCVINTGDRMIDFGVKSGGRYKYLEVLATAGGEQAIFASGDDLPTSCFWNWIVDTGVWDDERGGYQYTGSYIFGLNLETDAFDNGNSPNLLTNFTQYPTRQGTSQNYLSGQLTAYLGHIDTKNNVYIDTAAEAEAIRALSTSTETKFLRSRKGERWMIDTSGPIRLTLGDKYREQPYTVSLPWVEVGDASGAALISLPDDAAWPL